MSRGVVVDRLIWFQFILTNTFLVCGRCYLNNLSLKIALPARVNKVLREFAGKDLLDCYEVV